MRKGDQNLGSRINTDAEGNQCVGDECIRIIMPKDSNDVRIDLTECSPDLQRKIAQRITGGGSADFKVKPYENQSKNND